MGDGALRLSPPASGRFWERRESFFFGDLSPCLRGVCVWLLGGVCGFSVVCMAYVMV